MAPKTAAPSHPPYQEMIKQAIVALKERNGSSLAAVKKYIGTNFKLPQGWEKNLSVLLKKFVDSGKLVKVKASYKLGEPLKKAPVKPKSKKTAAEGVEKKAPAKPKKASAAEEKKKAPAKPKKAAADKKKKPAAEKKKTPAKKAAVKKTTATKKAAPKKKATAPKAEKAAAPKAKKAATTKAKKA